MLHKMGNTGTLLAMITRYLSSPDREIPYTKVVLKTPSTGFRLLWLIAGLAMGYITSTFHLPSIGFLALLALLAGVSGNWSS